MLCLIIELSEVKKIYKIGNEFSIRRSKLFSEGSAQTIRREDACAYGCLFLEREFPSYALVT